MNGVLRPTLCAALLALLSSGNLLGQVDSSAKADAILASLLSLDIVIMQDSQPFFGEAKFVSDPFRRPGKLESQGGTTKQFRPPEADHSYVLATLSIDAKTDFRFNTVDDVYLATASGEHVELHTMTNLMGVTVWVPTEQQIYTVNNGDKGKVTVLWIVHRQDLQSGWVYVFGTRHLLSEYVP